MGFGTISKKEQSMMFLATFARSYHAFYAIYPLLDDLDDGTGDFHPFRTICNALLSDSAVSWCKVFGSQAEKTHWKSIVDDEGDFRKVLFSELGVSKEDFHAYWLEMTEFRNNVIAHFNAEHFEAGSTPSFDLAMRSAAVAHRYMREHLPPNVNYVGPTCLDSYGKEVAAAVVARLNV